MILFLLEEFSKAVDCVDKGISLKQNLAQLHFIKAGCFVFKRDFNSALVSINKTCQLDPTHEDYRKLKLKFNQHGIQF